MKINQIERNLHAYQLEQQALAHRREGEYRQVVERKNFDRMVAERIARNIRLGLDKGQNIDIEC